MKINRTETIDDYIAGFPPAVQRVLKRVRAVIRKALPGADEVISYRIPAYRQDGRIVLYFAGWKEHFSLYPSTAPLVAAFKEELAPYEVNNKGTIRFPLSRPVPVHLISGIAKFRANEVAEAGKAKASVPPERRRPVKASGRNGAVRAAVVADARRRRQAR